LADFWTASLKRVGKHRLAVVLTHPVQYFSPWFRFMQANAPEIDLHVLYGVTPSADSQGRGFGVAFEWDRPLRDGYTSVVLQPDRQAQVSSETFSTLDAPALDAALIGMRPDFVLIPGWHAALYRRAMRVCHQHGFRALYRGDSNLSSGPASVLTRAVWQARTRARLREYSAFLSVGQRSREYLRHFDVPEPLTFSSPHAIDASQFPVDRSVIDCRALRQRFGLAPDLYTALFVGKLESKKRPLDAIRALRNLPSVQLLVVGAGPLDRACRDEAGTLGSRVAFAGFLNQREIGDAYATADCLVLPSDGRETWGLVVNEAMASGLPAIVSDRVGCQPDLVVDGETGAVFPCGDSHALAAAIERVRDLGRDPQALAARCRQHLARYDFAAATAGLVRACDVLTYQANAAFANRHQPTQVLTLCGHMVIPGGLERMTFEVTKALRRHGAGVHCLVNRWESSRIVTLAQKAGVAWSVARSDEPLRRRPGSPLVLLRMAWEIVRTSYDVLAAAIQDRSTHILVPDFLVTVRAWPALALLRLSGRRVILRVGMAPTPGRFYGRLWRWVVNGVVDRMVANSEFLYSEVLKTGVPARKVGLSRNTIVPRGVAEKPGLEDQRVVYVGQIIPDKGVDLLIDAVAALRHDGVPVTLDVVGEMSGWEAPQNTGYRAELRRRAADPRVQGAVRFLGYREDVGAVLGSAAVHCCPSRAVFREGMTNVVLEAKASGIPSVVTRTGSLPELVEHRVDGWIADDDSAAIAEGLRYFLDNAERRRRAGDAARRSLDRFSHATFEETWLREFGMSVPPVHAKVAS
jgi:glycosyltransferase involved in cell wall biosynthesis